MKRLNNIRKLSLPVGVARKLVQTMALKVLDYAPWQLVPKGQLSDVSAAIIGVLHPNLSRHRCVEIVLNLFHPGHTIDPHFLLIYRLIMAVGQHTRDHEPMHNQMTWPCAPLKLGLKSILWEALREVDIWIQPDSTAQTGRGAPISMRMPDQPERIAEWQHRWREALRNGLFVAAERRRPSYVGLAQGLNRPASRLLYDITEVQQWHFHLVSIASGACITEHAKAYGHDGARQPCPWCDDPLEDDWHRHWVCPHWQDVRDLWMEGCDYDAIPVLLRRYGLVPMEHDLRPEQILRCQAMLLHIELFAMADQCKTLRADPIHCLPQPGLIPSWLRSKPCRKLKRVYPEEPMPIVRELHPLAVGQHWIVPEAPTSYRCQTCAKSYSLSSLSSFPLCPCLPGRIVGVKVSAPRSSPKMVQYWRYVRHGKCGHVYGDVRPGHYIDCLKCGATWTWAQRHALPNKMCVRSKIKELARRAAYDESLPRSQWPHAEVASYLILLGMQSLWFSYG